MALFWMGFNCLKATELLKGGSLLFTSKFSEIPGTHLNNLRRLKDWVELGTTLWFWTRDYWIGNTAPYQDWWDQQNYVWKKYLKTKEAWRDMLEQARSP